MKVDKPYKVITSKPDSWGYYLLTIYKNRALIVTLAKRDLQIKYAQTLLGIAWVIIQPLSAVVIYTLFFNYFIKFNISYPFVLFVLSGVLLWGLFHYVFAQASTSLIQNQELIKKMYFPKLVLPLSKVLVALVEFTVVFGIFLILIIFFKIKFSFTIVFFFIAMIPVLLFGFGSALLLGSLSLRFRDLFHVLPFLINFGVWFTPVFFPVTIIPERYALLLYFNPVTTGIQFFRYCFFGEPLNDYMLIGFVVSIFFFIFGLVIFKRTEDKINDLI